MLKIPEESEFPGTGEMGNGIGENINSHHQWMNIVKTNGCMSCHQLGNKATRTIPKLRSRLPTTTRRRWLAAAFQTFNIGGGSVHVY